MIEQLEAANKALISENQEIKAGLEEIAVAYQRAHLFEQWFSVQENAEIQTALAKAQSENERLKREKKGATRYMEKYFKMLKDDKDFERATVKKCRK